MKEQTSRGELVLESKIVEEDLVITLTGGKGHIGAVAVGYYDRIPGHASSSVITLPSHRDDAIALDAARRISSVTHSTTVFTAGIHFENITAEEIEEVLSASNKLIDEFIRSMKEK
ncbi:MAG: hypothetical protein GKC08_04615 [Methanosarcinales archaeon]|nr:hypothetical protein [Methanosarcinales archaeon]